MLNVMDGKEKILDLLLLKDSDQTQESNDSPGYEEIALSSEHAPANSALHAASYPRFPAISQSPTDKNSPHESSKSVSNPLGLVADVCKEVQEFDRSSNPTLSLLTSNPEHINFHATSFPETEPLSLAHRLLRRPGYVSLGLKLDRKTLEDGLNTLLHKKIEIYQYLDYFKPVDTNKGRDTGPEYDPVDLCLVTMEEAHSLFPL